MTKFIDNMANIDDLDTTLTMSEELHKLEESTFIDDIVWTINDYSLSHAHLFGISDHLCEEQPLLITLNEDGSVPSMLFVAT